MPGIKRADVLELERISNRKDAMPATTASGLIIDDVVVGSGDAAAAGQKVTVHYTGWLFYGGESGKSSIPARTAATRSSSRLAPATSSRAGTRACRA